ncbi:MAG: hypothetical protein K2H20_00435 [Bacilli bacterium]|nr:hypothetical protein [Bacilli bacterium]
MKKDNELNLDFIITRRYKLTESTLNEVADEIQRTYGVEVLGIVETEEGYVFRGKYDFTIGDLTFDSKRGGYQTFNYHRGVKESIKEKDAEMAKASRQRRYKVQRNKILGTALTAGAVALFITIGVIKATNTNQPQTTLDRNETVAVVNHLNTIDNANDLLLLAWANYAMGEVSDFCESSEIDALREMRPDIYSNVFVPVMTDYYKYLDYVDSPLPEEIIGESLKSTHSSFRNSVIEFNEYLKSMNFNSFTFANSPFADAVVFDKSGEVALAGDRFEGEVKTSDGELLTYDEESYSVYIRAVDVPNNNYSITNVPEDAKLFNGETYVDYTHLYNNKELDNKSK